MRTQLALCSLCVGIALCQLQGRLPPLWLSTTLLVLCTVLLSFALLRQRRTPVALLLLYTLLAGWSYASLRADFRMNDELPAAWEGRDIAISGRIDGLPQTTEFGLRFPFRVETVHSNGALVPSRISLNWYPARSGELAGEPLPSLHGGEQWQLTVRLNRPRGLVNFQGFVAETWLLENNIRATGNVRNDEPNRRLSATGGHLVDHINRWRDRARERMRTTLADKPYAGPLIALAIGDQQAISDEHWALFNLTAVSHLLSISGSHVTLFASFIGCILLGLWRRSPRLMHYASAQHAVSLAMTVIAFGYAVIAGFDVPAQRTCYMLLVAAIALSLRRQLSAWLVFCWALTVVLLIDPWAVLAVGFWFSFTAVASLIFITQNRPTRPWWQNWLMAQLAVTLVLAPLTILNFQQVSLVGPVANVFAIPAVTVVITPLVLISMLLPVDAILLLAHALLSILVSVLQWLAQSPLALWTQPTATQWSIAAALMGMFWLLAPRGWPHRWLGFVWCLPMLFPAINQPEPGDLRITMIDVGQGSAILVQTAQHQLLYDSGPRWGDDSDAGKRVVAPYLRAMGVATLNNMIISHTDSDHSGGAASILQQLSVQNVLSSAADDSDLAKATLQHAVSRQRCEAGQHWQWDGIKFEMLYPSAAEYDEPRISSNDLSCVMKISTPRHQILLTGDLSAKKERVLMERYDETLQSTVLLAPHHGSHSSSSEVFIDSVKPSHVLINAGYRNRFGHPAASVVERYQARNITMLRNDLDGGIRIDATTSGLHVQKARETLNKYWLQ